MKTYSISTAILLAIIEMLPKVGYDTMFDLDSEGKRPGLVDFDVTCLPDGDVCYTVDNDGTHLFLVRHQDTLNIISRYHGLDPNELLFVFNGSQVIANIIGCNMEDGAVTLDVFGAFFAFFGPESASHLVIAAMDEVSREAQAAADAAAAEQAAGQSAANDTSVDEVTELLKPLGEAIAASHLPDDDASLSPQERLARLVKLRSENPAAKVVETETVTIVRFDTPVKKAALIGAVTGVLGLALYGGYRLFRS